MRDVEKYKNKGRLNVTIDKEILKDFKKLAKEECINISGTIEQYLDSILKENKRKRSGKNE